MVQQIVQGQNMPIYKILQDKLQPKEAEDTLQSVRKVKKGPRCKKSKGDQPPVLCIKQQ